MLTNGWRRFNWTELTKQGIPYKDNAYITLAGKATLRGIKQPFADKQMLLMITGVNKRRSTHLLQTGRDGNFVLDSLIFFDKNWLLFCDVRGKKSQYIDVLLSGDSLHRNFSLPVTAGKPYRYSNASDQARWKMDYDAIARVNGLMLEGVTIKVHKKTPLQELDEKYTSGLFYGDANKVIDLVNNDEAAPYNNIFDYLQSRVNGLQISEDGLDYSIYYRQPTSAVSSLGNIPVTLFLDEVETDASLIASIPANQVALIKLFSTFAGASGNGPGGVLAIYTKKGSDYVGSAGPAAYSVYNGYSVIKEFYAPDYKVPKAANKPDNRITLDWRPGIYFNSVNPTIPFSFYNNDRTSRFKIIVEGMTTDGKLIMLEKTIGKKAF